MTDATTQTANPLEASDDDFLNMMPPSAPAVEAGAEEADAGAAADEGKDGEGGGEPDNSGAAADDNDDAGKAAEAGAEGGDAVGSGEAGADAGASGAAADGEAKPGGEAAPAAESGKTFSVPISFKANGKDIELKSEAEALALMQMGANYTRKMQELQPHRKMLMMLQNNELMDEGQLSFLIDLAKGDKAAIQKLIKDNGIDPLDLDVTEDDTYKPGNHAVSDEEAGFRTAIQDLSSDEAGQETLRVINTKWDDASKEVIWKSPEIMGVFHEQRLNGVYDRITTEMERQITLGKISTNTPFLQAYKQVGDELMAAASGGNGQDGGQSGKEPIATRTAAPKPALANGDQAAAASPSRAAPAGAKPKPTNPLQMSDDEFLKVNQFEGRV